MNLTVRIERMAFGGIQGCLKAWVVDGGVKGSNLLAGKQISRIQTAQSVILDRLRRELRHAGEIKLHWQLPEDPGPA